MYRRIAIAIFTLSIGVHCYAQRDPERGWTDKNNAEKYAAYMIQIAYSERGYMGARVQVRDDGATEVFECTPAASITSRLCKFWAGTIYLRRPCPPRRLLVTFTPTLA
jgi:hypothetical protein